MNDFGKDLLLALIGVVAAKALDELVEVLKEKASRPPGKHRKKP